MADGGIPNEYRRYLSPTTLKKLAEAWPNLDAQVQAAILEVLKQGKDFDKTLLEFAMRDKDFEQKLSRKTQEAKRKFINKLEEKDKEDDGSNLDDLLEKIKPQ
ncbi:hypothetical protein KKC94_04770 [Patescibacteria group bacterium]|nr:hypothetical protein [Patescibacteria group bacterium]